MNQADTIAHILQNHRTVAVVGLSPKAYRDSHDVALYMQLQGWRIVPVNPAALGEDILGEKVYATLMQAARFVTIDLVNIFRKSVDVPPVVDDAIAIGARGIWMQLGIEHAKAADKARQAGLLVVQDRCLMVEHKRGV